TPQQLKDVERQADAFAREADVLGARALRNRRTPPRSASRPRPTRSSSIPSRAPATRLRSCRARSGRRRRAWWLQALPWAGAGASRRRARDGETTKRPGDRKPAILLVLDPVEERLLRWRTSLDRSSQDGTIATTQPYALRAGEGLADLWWKTGRIKTRWQESIVRAFAPCGCEIVGPPPTL